ncbi:MAG: FG-GAP repeat domain-containing protein [Akkermansiaceae bacterium]
MRPDLYVIDEFGDGILLLNREDGFEGVELNKAPTDFGSMGMTVGDINNDGVTDIDVSEMYSKAGKRVIANLPEGTYSEEVMTKLRRLVDGSQLYLGTGEGKFKGAGISMGVDVVGWAWGASLADFNNDGWLDLFATAGFMSHELGKPDG